MLPTTTHLQNLSLAHLCEGETSGRDLRACLTESGAVLSAPAFYQLMSRLEDSKLVEGWYELVSVNGKRVRERRYRITGAGRYAYQTTLQFYLSTSQFPGTSTA